MRMKKILALLLALAMVFCLAACGGSGDNKGEENSQEVASANPSDNPSEEVSEEPTKDPVEIIVFAAASMTETLTELGNKYMEENEHVTLVFNFESSGTLKTQIQEGADCDIFVSAGQKQMDQLDISASADVNTEGLDFVLEGTRLNLLENKIALAVPEGNPAGIESYDQLAELLKEGNVMLAMGNADVPVGQYTQKIFAFYDIDEAAVASCLTYGSNVKEVQTQVQEATVDCGIIYATDAASAGLEVVATATAEMCGQVIYPAAVMNTTLVAEEAQAFLDYLLTAEAEAVFDSVGFTVVK